MSENFTNNQDELDKTKEAFLPPKPEMSAFERATKSFYKNIEDIREGKKTQESMTGLASPEYKAFRGIPQTDQESLDAARAKAMATKFGFIQSDTDPTLSPDSDGASVKAETVRELQTELFGSEIDIPPAPLTLGLKDLPEEKSLLEVTVDQGISKTRAALFGAQDTLAFQGGVPIVSSSKQITEDDRQAGVLGSLEGLVLFGKDILELGVREGATAVGARFSNKVPGAVVLDIGNYLKSKLSQDELAEPTVYSKFYIAAIREDVQDFLNSASKGLQDATKDILSTYGLMEDDESLRKFYYDIRNPLGVPEAERDDVNIALSIMGLYAPLGGIGAGVNAGRIVKRHAQSMALGAYVVKKAGFKALYDIPSKRQFFDFDVGKKTLPDIGDNLYNLLKDDKTFLKKVKKFEESGLPRDKARAKALSRRRDFFSAAMAGALYSLSLRAFDSEGAALGMSIIGSFTGNLAASYGTRFGGGTAKDQFFKTLALFNSGSIGQRDKALEAFKNSDSQNISTGYQKTFLRLNGMTNQDIKEMYRESLEMGRAVKKEIRQQLQDGNKIEADRLLRQSISDGLLNDKGLPHRFYLASTILDSKFNKQTLQFGSVFRKRVLNSENAEQFENMMLTVHGLVDRLSKAAPEAMNKFPLLIEQVTGFAALQAMRNSLVNQASFSALNGKVIRGDYLTEAERYHQLLITQSSQLRESMDEIRKAVGEEAKPLNDFVDMLSQGLINKDLGYTQKRIDELRKFANNPRNKRLEELEEKEDFLVRTSQVEEVGDAKLAYDHGVAQQGLLRDAFYKTQQKASEPFKKLTSNPLYDDLTINVDSFLESVPRGYLQTEGGDALFKLLTDFSQLGVSESNKIRNTIAKNFLQKRLGLGENIDETSYNNVKDTLLRFIDNTVSATPDRKKQIEESVFGNADSILTQQYEGANKDAIDSAINSLLNIPEIQIPAEVSINTYMDIRSGMAREARRRYDAGEFKDYHDMSDRIAALDNTLSNNTTLGRQFLKEYGEARDQYRRIFEPFLDRSGPFSFFQPIEGARQAVSQFKLFEMFHTPMSSSRDFTKNREQFDNIFFDPETKTYKKIEILDDDGNVIQIADPIEELMYSFATRMTTSYKQGNHQTIDEVLKDSYLAFKPVFEKAGLDDFIKSVEGFAELNSIKLLSSEDDKIAVRSAINVIVDKLDDFKKEAFKNSAAKLLGAIPADKYDMMVQQSLNDTASLQAALLQRGGRSIDINSKEFFIEQLHRSPSFREATSAQREEILRIVNSQDFQDELTKITKGEIFTAEKTLSVLLQDAQNKVEAGLTSEKDLENLKKSSFNLIYDNFTSQAFSFVQQVKPEDLHARSSKALTDIATEMGISKRKVTTLLKQGDMNVRSRFVDKGLNEVEILEAVGKTAAFFSRGKLTPAYTLNLNNEFDPVAARKWFDEHKEVLALTLTDKKGKLTKEGQQHLADLETLLQLGTQLRTSFGPQSIKDVPTAYTTQMALGRIYNSFGKRVVSPTYIGMENAVVNYRVMQANIIRDILISPETSNIFKNIYAKGLFEPRKVKDFIRDFTVRVAVFGGKMTQEKQVEMYQLMLEDAQETRKMLEDERKARASEPVEQVNESGVPLGFEMGGQGFSPRTGEFYDITEELPD